MMDGGSAFQFHKGTIRTDVGQRAWRVRQFQFHKGTIRTRVLSRQRRRVNNFNSIKVQLEHFRFYRLYY